MSKYRELQAAYFPQLEMYTLAITRAHGKKYPETFQVHELFEQIVAKSQSDADLSSEYQQMSELTADFSIPADACPTMEKTYQFLAELKQAYQAEK